ncbi:MAG: 4Fe-4S binding protein [Oligoflexia bacterium]|nr:4Fe-4S binding protein [Oligoflexia bacterium]
MTANQQKNKEKAKPFLFHEFCKGCGRCIEACPKNCIVIGKDINAFTGLLPVKISLDNCIGHSKSCKLRIFIVKILINSTHFCN